MEIYFIRHGETDWNARGLLQGTSEIPLNENGIMQAWELAKKIKAHEFDAAYASPMLRARQTAEIVLDRKTGGIIIEDSLRERHFGEFEGKPVEEYRSLANNDERYNPKGAETRDEIKKRAREFFNSCIASGKKKILVVAHGGVFSALLRAVFGVERGQAHNYRIGNCGLYVIKAVNDRVMLIKDGKIVLEKNL